MTIYHEKYRPQFHFTARKNWLNDPNGLVYFGGEYHLFFQHNPDGNDWGKMSWGHAISRDLLHWEELPVALYHDQLGYIYSGSAVVDWNNSTGFQVRSQPPLVAAFTHAGGKLDPPKPFIQSLAYSTDRGRSWTKYDQNPVIENIGGYRNRDPKIFWYAPTQQWVMILFLDDPEKSFAIFNSADLKTWQQTSTITGFHECPDLFALPLDGDTNHMRWVLTDAKNNYQIGDFDGKKFTPETALTPQDVGYFFYAAQSYNNLPDYRRVQLAWMHHGTYPDMPFNQQMTFPCDLSLRTVDGNMRLCRTPITEIQELYDESLTLDGQTLATNEVLETLRSDCFDATFALEFSENTELCWDVHGVTISYHSGRQELTCGNHTVPLTIKNQQLELRLLVDRTSLEIFAPDRAFSYTHHFVPAEIESILRLTLQQGSVRITSGRVSSLKSIW